MTRVFVIAPHPDDEVLGCGGTICSHTDAGDHVTVAFLSSGERGLPQEDRAAAARVREGEARQAAEILGCDALEFLRGPDGSIAETTDRLAPRLAMLIRAAVPDLIYLPHPVDDHPDHAAALPLLRAALELAGSGSPALRGYEIWSPLPNYQHLRDVSAYMDRKMRALRAHASQCGYFDYETAIRGLNSYRGELGARCRFAEVFTNLP